jgi:hypothetical protein
MTSLLVPMGIWFAPALAAVLSLSPIQPKTTGDTEK